MPGTRIPQSSYLRRPSPQERMAVVFYWGQGRAIGKGAVRQLNPPGRWTVTLQSQTPGMRSVAKRIRKAPVAMATYTAQPQRSARRLLPIVLFLQIGLVL